jgi:hypothetical protein
MMWTAAIGPNLTELARPQMNWFLCQPSSVKLGDTLDERTGACYPPIQQQQDVLHKYR